MFFRYTVDNEVHPWSFSGEEQVVIAKDGSIWGADVYAQDADHARKKAQDMIAKYMAELAGI